MRPLVLLLIASLAGLAGVPNARAQAPPSAQQANELAREAKAKYDQGDWAGALALFESAEALAHSPVLLLYAARCQRNLGKLARARELLERVVAEKLASDAPAPFVNAQKDAAGDLQALEARIPKIIINRGEAPASWVVEIDGVRVERELEVEPGNHRVVAKEGGEMRFEREVAVAEGASVTVAVRAAGRAPGAMAPPDPHPDEASSAVLLVPGLVALGVGTVGVGIGVALRAMALETVSDVKDRCIEGRCLESDEAEIEDAETLQTASTILFVAGGALAATGVVLLIVLPGDDNGVAVGPGYLGLRGRF